MGYYTRFELNVLYTQPDQDRLEADFLEITEYELKALHDDTHKWYNYDADMITLSLRYPSTAFELYGEGEDSGDVWRTCYCNGHKAGGGAEIVYPEVDFKQLGDLYSRHPELFI